MSDIGLMPFKIWFLVFFLM